MMSDASWIERLEKVHVGIESWSQCFIQRLLKITAHWFPLSGRQDTDCTSDSFGQFVWPVFCARCLPLAARFALLLAN